MLVARNEKVPSTVLVLPLTPLPEIEVIVREPASVKLLANVE